MIQIALTILFAAAPAVAEPTDVDWSSSDPVAAALDEAPQLHWKDIVRALGGNFAHPPEDAAAVLSPAALKLIDSSFADVEPSRLRDYHTHLLAVDGKATGGGYLYPKEFHLRHPLDLMQVDVYKDAAGVTGAADPDASYVERLVKLIRAIPGHGKHYLLAFDQSYDREGRPEPHPDRTEFYVPNEYAVSVAHRYPDVFIPAVSVHPFRPDAISEVKRWAAQGVRLIKWLPNSQNIPVDDPRLDAFYDAVREAGMTILTHTGEEKAVTAPDLQELGNPLRLRRALDHGVKIIMAHGASLGLDKDLDAPGQPPTPGYLLALRLLREPRYRGLLYADISAMTQVNRQPEPVRAFLAATDVHDRLVNGSDYPLPAVNVLIQLNPLVKAGLLDRAEVIPLREIYGVNPLLFDYVLKRRLHGPNGERFPPAVFMSRPGLAAD